MIDPPSEAEIVPATPKWRPLSRAHEELSGARHMPLLMDAPLLACYASARMPPHLAAELRLVVLPRCTELLDCSLTRVYQGGPLPACSFLGLIPLHLAAGFVSSSCLTVPNC